jgi:hypothetical protein
MTTGSPFFFDRMVEYINTIGNILKDTKSEVQATEDISCDETSTKTIQRVKETVTNGIDRTLEQLSDISLEFTNVTEKTEHEALTKLPSGK